MYLFINYLLSIYLFNLYLQNYLCKCTIIVPKKIAIQQNASQPNLSKN